MVGGRVGSEVSQQVPVRFAHANPFEQQVDTLPSVLLHRTCPGPEQLMSWHRLVVALHTCVWLQQYDVPFTSGPHEVYSSTQIQH